MHRLKDINIYIFCLKIMINFKKTSDFAEGAILLSRGRDLGGMGGCWKSGVSKSGNCWSGDTESALGRTEAGGRTEPAVFKE